MKNTLSLLVSLILSSVLFAQGTLNWVTLNTGTNKKINDIYFHSPDVGYIVGNNYLFKKTTDGGATWVDLPAPNIGERPGNGGNLIGIDYHSNFSALDSGLYLTWEKGYHGISTTDDGVTYKVYAYNDSNQFCLISGFSISPANRGNGYTNLYTFGENCNGNAAFHNYYDGPFSVVKSDTTTSANSARFTTVDVDSFSSIIGHSNGYLLKYPTPFSTPDSIFLDASGVSAIAYAGSYKWYACTNSGSGNMYVSIDSGKTFSVDNSYNPNLFVAPTINEFSFLPSGIGIGGAISNGSKGAIVVRDSSRWDLYPTLHPINSVKLFGNGVAFAAGDSGLIMKTTILTSLNERSIAEHQWQIYPNPSNSEIYFNGLEQLNISSIQLLDLEGRLVQTFTSQKNKLDVSDLPKGIYIIRVITEERVLAKRVFLK